MNINFFLSDHHLASIGGAAIVLAVAGCGGGGSSSNTGPSGNAAVANVFPSVTPTMGGYYVYQETVSVGPGFTLPTPSVYTYTRTYTSANPLIRTDFEARSDGPSLNFLKTTRTFDASLKEVSYSSGSTNCTYSPSFVLAPPSGATPNAAFSSSSVRTCVGGIGPADNFALNGTAVGLEDVTVAAGNFKAFKYTATRTIKNTGSESTSNGTFWADGVTGRTIKFVQNVKANSPGSTVLTGDVTFTTELIAYNAQSLGASALTTKRFAGGWVVPYGGSVSGSCLMTITAAGLITGSCSGTGNSPSVSGTVSDAGALSVTLSDGTRITGNLTSPGAGSGTWVNGTDSGSWTAAHR